MTDEKKRQCADLVTVVLKLLSNGVTARQIMTKKVYIELSVVMINVLVIIIFTQAFENAITVMYALGGSTNGVLHLLAMAKELVINNFIIINK